MAVVGTAEVILRVSTTALDKQITEQVNAALKSAEQQGARLKNVSSQSSQATGVLGRALADLRSRLRSVAESGGPVSSELANITEKIIGLGGVAGGVALGIAALAGAAIVGTEKFIAFGEQVHQFQLVSGASAETASRFVVAMRILGVEPDRVGAGLFRMGRQIADGTSKLQALGVQTARNRDGNVNLTETFLNVADAVHRASGDGDKAAVAFAAFGKQGLALLPVLDRGREGLRDLFAQAPQNGQLFSQGDEERAIQLKVRINELKEALNGLAVEAGRHSVGIVGTATGLATTAIRVFNNEANVTLSLLGRLTGQHHAAGESAAVHAERLKLLDAEFTDLRSSVFGLLDAQQGLANADLAEQSAQLQLANATRELAKLRREGPVDAKAVQSAQQQLESSNRSLSQAYDQLSTATQHFLDVQAGPTPRELARAQLEVSQANDRVARAEENLTKVQRGHRVSALDLQEAQDEVTQAQLDAADAADNLATVQAKGTDADKEYVDAQKQVADAVAAVQDATERQAQAAADLRTAQAGDPEFAFKIRDAENAVAQARNSVTAASISHLEAAAKLRDAIDNQATAFGADADAVGALREQLAGLATDFHVNIEPILEILGGGLFGGPVSTAAQASDTRLSRFDKRARGGSVQGGKWYQVNEEGPEYFQPNSSGTIIPVGDPRAPSSSGPMITQHIYGTDDPYTTSQLVGIETARALRTAPR